MFWKLFKQKRKGKYLPTWLDHSRCNTDLGPTDQRLVATKTIDPFAGAVKAVCCQFPFVVCKLEWMDSLSCFARAPSSLFLPGNSTYLIRSYRLFAHRLILFLRPAFKNFVPGWTVYRRIAPAGKIYDSIRQRATRPAR